MKVWIVTRLNGKLGIQCPYKDCRGKAVVSRLWLRSFKVDNADKQSKITIRGRACTYCFRASEIPEEMRK